jgi:hypothetical protein
MEDVGDKVGHMLNMEASHDCTAEGQVNQTDKEAIIDKLTRKHLW